VLMWAAVTFVWWWPLAVADFRREYGLSPADLADVPATEFAQLVIGLSRRSEVSRRVSGDPEDKLLEAVTGSRVRGPSRPQQRYTETPKVATGDDYIRSVRRLHGKVHVTKREKAQNG
jgi:hypothetical protein